MEEIVVHDPQPGAARELRLWIQAYDGSDDDIYIAADKVFEGRDFDSLSEDERKSYLTKVLLDNKEKIRSDVKGYNEFADRMNKERFRAPTQRFE